MRLGLNLVPPDAGALLEEAERLGFAYALAPEGLRDAVSVIGWAVGRTTEIGLVSGVCQIPARTPAMMAMTAATLGTLSGGRFRLGLGVSNPHATEGWYGRPFAGPLHRTREYVEIVRMALRGEEARYDGAHYRLPLDESGTGLRLPAPAPVPIFLAAVGPRNLELAGELGDGWIGTFLSPDRVRDAVARIGKGRERAVNPAPDFEVVLTVPMALGDGPVAELARPIAQYAAHFLSMGHREENFYYRIAVEMGYGEAARFVQDRYVAGDRRGAAEAVPFEFVDAMSLLGPPERVADRLKAYAEAGVTTLCVGPIAPTEPERLAALRTVAGLL
ncbi:LLM class flavin-dependent oxidoreductase [Nonomuraea sp. NPDC050643]|uniref:LLM class flavin-dependent oxidoreductase n=1 Tax=Nonomuraea sp. NPDC050643 TaxID=3155660 RepID=UPI00340F89B8